MMSEAKFVASCANLKGQLTWEFLYDKKEGMA